MIHIALKSAYICIDCEAVSASAVYCPACGSYVMLCLANVLDRETEPQPELEAA